MINDKALESAEAKLNNSDGVFVNAKDTATGQLLNLWLRAKHVVKTAEAVIEALKPKMGMLLPVDTDARAFKAVQVKKGKDVMGRVVLRRVEQDRRKPDQVKLAELLVTKFGAGKVPDEAYSRVVNEDYIAVLCERGTITAKELQACLVGTQPKYVMATFSVDPEDMKLPEE